MELRNELKKQGPVGWINMALGFLGATGFFSWLYLTYEEYVSANWLVFLLFVLLFISSVITFISRRQLATSKNNSTINNSHADEKSTEPQIIGHIYESDLKAKELQTELAKANEEIARQKLEVREAEFEAKK